MNDMSGMGISFHFRKWIIYFLGSVPKDVVLQRYPHAAHFRYPLARMHRTKIITKSSHC
jgi:hypothetical protein